VKQPTRARIRNILTTLLEVVGLAAVTYGVWSIFQPAGFIFGGFALVGFSYLIVRNGGTR
jgi:hypothetical protein